MDYFLRTRFSEHAFCHAGPVISNALPDNICTVADFVIFQKVSKLPILALLLSDDYFYLCFTAHFGLL